MSKFIALLGAIEIDSTNDAIYLEYGAGSYATCTLTHGTYYLRGDSTSSCILKHIGDVLTASASSNIYGLVVTSAAVPTWDTNPANKSVAVSVNITGAQNFRVRWLHANTTFPGEALGFVAEKGAANTSIETSTLSPTSVWVANEYHKDIAPTTRWDIGSTPLASGDTSVVRRSDKMQAKEILFQWLDGRRVWMHENTSDPTATLEKFIDTNNDGRPIEIHEQSLYSSAVTTLSALSSSTKVGSTWRLGEGGGDVFAPQRTTLGLSLWDLDLALVGAV